MYCSANETDASARLPLSAPLACPCDGPPRVSICDQFRVPPFICAEAHQRFRTPMVDAKCKSMVTRLLHSGLTTTPSSFTGSSGSTASDSCTEEDSDTAPSSSELDDEVEKCNANIEFRGGARQPEETSQNFDASAQSLRNAFRDIIKVNMQILRGGAPTLEAGSKNVEVHVRISRDAERALAIDAARAALNLAASAIDGEGVEEIQLCSARTSGDHSIETVASRVTNAEIDLIRNRLREAVTDAKNLRLALTGMSELQQVRSRLVQALSIARHMSLVQSEFLEADLYRRKIHDTIQDLKGQIRVYCRVRPMSAAEESRGEHSVVRIVDDTTLEIPNCGAFSFNRVFSPGSQEQIFEGCRDLVQSAIDGRNTTIFSYGVTGTGKTYTMYGTPAEKGIAARVCAELFTIIDASSHRRSFEVTASMVELYNNRLVDLLRPTSSTALHDDMPKLAMQQDGTGRLRVVGLEEKRVHDSCGLLELLRRGVGQRAVAASSMNSQSSRSHLIFTLKVQSVNPVTNETLTGKILLCDLGGSENLKKNEPAGDRMREAIELNKSLTALGNVIGAVAKKQKLVPYRDHKLTQLLQDSIGGSSKTLMFINCSPCSSNVNQTLTSLKYAERVRKIVNARPLSSSCAF